MIKKLFAFIITLFFVCNLASCSSTATVKHYGIEGYSRAHSSIEISENLIPFLNEEDQYDKTFLSEYPYIDGDYYRSYPSFSLILWLLSIMKIKDPELEIMYLIYDPETYAQAKTCALEKLQLSQENVFEYNNYHFSENTAIRSSHSRFPETFNLFGYNDEKRTLIFIGYYIGMTDDVYKSDFPGLYPFDIEVFLKTYFSEFYDFDA